MSIGAIHAALDGHLRAMEGLPPTAWPNVKFDPPKDGSLYLKVSLLSAPEAYSELGRPLSFRMTGIYQVGVSAPGGSGSGEAEDLADRIAAHFRGRTLGRVRANLAEIGQAMPDEGRVWLPVSISFTADFMAGGPAIGHKPNNGKSKQKKRKG